MAKSSLPLLTCLMFLLFPWYYFASGNLQPCDIPIFFILCFLFLSGFPFLSLMIRNAAIYKIFLWFSLYIIVVLLINFIVNNFFITLFLLEEFIYYIILLSMFLMLLYYFKKIKGDQLYNLILFFLVLDLLLPFGKWLSLGVIGSREGLTFNNANQLGFFVLVNLSILYYIALMARERNVSLNKIQAFIVLNVNLLFLFVSISRACYPVILVYVISYFLIFNLKLKGFAKWLVGGISIFIAFFLLVSCGHKLLAYMQHTRLDVGMQTTKSILSDFYFRAIQGAEASFNNVGTFLFGNGTYTTSGRTNLEFHNNFIAIFFQVGFIGLLIYLLMNIMIIVGLLKKGPSYLIPYLCYLYYSMFHYSYRARINWLLLAVIIFTIVQQEKKFQIGNQGSNENLDYNFNI